tara:strand:+ start:2144 stop:3298 length:1155 start_codon:yes stop_codon:yes gene_type:complete
MNKKKNILFHLESRATYGYARNVLRVINEFPELEYSTVVTGGHLDKKMGESINIIKSNGFKITKKVPFVPSIQDSKFSWASGIGNAIDGYTKSLNEIKPDIVLLFGDRIETLSMCISAAYSHIPIAHVQAGDKSGHIDDCARYAIAKLAHIHFASCEDSAIRLKKLGEQEFRIFNTGAPQLDDLSLIHEKEYITIEGKPFNLKIPFILLVQHPVFVESEDSYKQMQNTLSACIRFNMPILWIYPNNDIGYLNILKLLEYSSISNKIIPVSNLERDEYLLALKKANALVGNSSSGILESPSYKVPVVNIGNRQRGRPQAKNIINCGHNENEIYNSINIAINSKDFKETCNKAINPYGDGQSSRRICDLLSRQDISRNLMDKITIY